jgi:thymidylate synthase
MAEYDHVPGLEEQLTREPRALPRLEISPDVQNLDDVTAVLEADTESLLQTFRLHDYHPHPALTFKVAV